MAETQDTTIKEAGTLDKAKSLAVGVTNWAKGGFTRVTEKQFYHRLQLCQSCPHWNQTAFLNTGGCKICGCSSGKLYMPQSNCPHPQPRWLRTDGSVRASVKAVPLPVWTSKPA